MKIAFTTDYYWPQHRGGTERVVYEVARWLAARGHEVRVVTISPGRPGTVWQEGVEVVGLPGFDLAESTGLSVSIPRTGVLNHLDGFDIVNGHHMLYSTTALAMLAAPQPKVLTLHVGGFRHAGWFLPSAVSLFEHTVGRLMVKRAARLTAVSKALADRAVRTWGAHERMRVIPNAVDTLRFSENGHRRDRSLLFAGRLVRNKGPDLLIRALPQVLQEHPDVSVDMIGIGPMYAELTELARGLGVSDHVRFLGEVSDEVMVQRLQSASIYVRPSLSDGMPLGVLEAMACGAAVVASDVGGTREIVTSGTDGLLHEPGVVAQVSERINLLLGDEGLAARMRARAKTKIAQWFSWDAVARQYLALYEGLLVAGTR